ncbi:hypothetical protein ACP4OV_018538 [Aristida adscensionis]
MKLKVETVAGRKRARMELGIWSLRQTQADAARFRGPATVVLHAAKLSDVRALIFVLRQRKRWRVVDGPDRLRAAARVDTLISLALNALIPLAADHVYTPHYLTPLKKCSWRMERSANLVSRKLAQKVHEAGAQLRRFANYGLKRTKRWAWFEAKVPQLEELLAALKDHIVLFDDEPATAPAPAPAPAVQD